MRKYILIIFLVIFLTSIVCADPSFYIPKDTVYDLKISCEINGFRCPATTLCNLTSEYPNSTTMIDDKQMSNLGNGFYNYTLNLNETSTVGEYNDRVECSDPGTTLNDTSTFSHEVNPTGIRPSEQRTESLTRAIYIIFGIAILLFIGFLFTTQTVPVKWTFFMLSIIFMLMAINLLFIGIQDEVVNPKLETFFDSFAAISFIMFWFMGGLLIIIWIFTFFNTWILKKNMSNLKRFGGE